MRALIRHPDVLSAAFLLASGAAMFFFSTRIQVNEGVAFIDAQFFPKVMSAGIFLCGIGVAIQAARAEPAPLPFLFNRANALVAAFLCIYFLYFEEIDFRLNTWGLMIACMWVLGARSILQLILTPLITAFLTFWMFTDLFEVVLPRWI